jgi:hypothetical protein
VFEPFEIHISAGATETVALGGVLDFAWPGPDCWEIYRAELRVASSCGASKQALQPGIYTVKARSGAVFEPFAVHISAGATETAAFGGVLEFTWPGSDCWEVYRDERRVSSSCGAGKQALQAGIYTVKARSSLVFEPFEVTITDGESTVAP